MTETRVAYASQEITMDALKYSAVDLREFVKADIRKKLAEVTDGSPWFYEPEFEEKETVRLAAIYADDADDDAEPIDYEEIPVLLIRGTVKYRV